MAAPLTLTSTTDSLLRQFPYRLLKDDATLCEWIANTPENFTEPFFDETITRLKSATVNQGRSKTVAPIGLLAEWAARNGWDRKPTCLIFHVSRCGSTLFSQLLALQPQHMVLSEVPFFDELLRLPFKNTAISAEEAGSLFHAALQFYINCAPSSPAHVFIKTDSWHLHFYKQLRSLYPTVPFILLYRDPWEVVQSQQRRRSMQSVPGLIEPDIFGFTSKQASEYNLDKYMAHVLQSYLKKIIHIATHDTNSVLINYNEGVVAGIKKISTATNIKLSSQHEHMIEQRAGFHAKYPGQVFKEENLQAAPPSFLNPALALYDKLESIRTQDALV
jgi:hypothetical protein